jgi:hypothetical protein
VKVKISYGSTSTLRPHFSIVSDLARNNRVSIHQFQHHRLLAVTRPLLTKLFLFHVSITLRISSLGVQELGIACLAWNVTLSSAKAAAYLKKLQGVTTTAAPGAATSYGHCQTQHHRSLFAGYHKDAMASQMHHKLQDSPDLLPETRLHSKYQSSSYSPTALRFSSLNCSRAWPRSQGIQQHFLMYQG